MRVLPSQLLCDRFEPALSLGNGNSRPQASYDEDVVAIALVNVIAAGLDLFGHHHRHIEFGQVRDLDTAKILRSYPNDGVRLSINRNLVANHTLIGSKSFLPAAVANDDQWICAR